MARTAVSALSFLALAAEVEGAGVTPVEDVVDGFSDLSLGFSFSLSLSGLGASGRGPNCIDVEVVVGVDCEVELLVCTGLGEAKDEEVGGLLGIPDVGRLREGTLLPGIFRFGGFGGVKAERQIIKDYLQISLYFFEGIIYYTDAQAKMGLKIS